MKPSIYVKCALSRAKRLPVDVPRARVLYEAQATEVYARLGGPSVLVPRCLFVDETHFAIGLSDVGRGRVVLLDRPDGGYAQARGLARALGDWLGRLARGSQAALPLRSEEVASPAWQAYRDLLAVGLRVIDEDAIQRWLEPLCQRRESFVHSDLWAKNLLVGRLRRPALVDFENADLGDPALDLAAVVCLFLLPRLEGRVPPAAYAQFTEAFLGRVARRAPWLAGSDTSRRTFATVGIYLALRAVGATRYTMSEATRERCCELAYELLRRPPTALHDFLAVSQRLAPPGLLAT